MAKSNLFFKYAPHKQRTLCVVYIELLIDVVIEALSQWFDKYSIGVWCHWHGKNFHWLMKGQVGAPDGNKQTKIYRIEEHTHTLAQTKEKHLKKNLLNPFSTRFIVRVNIYPQINCRRKSWYPHSMPTNTTHIYSNEFCCEPQTHSNAMKRIFRPIEHRWHTEIITICGCFVFFCTPSSLPANLHMLE